MNIYRCGNKRCRSYHREFQAMDPAAARLATGRGITCNACGDVVWFVRRVEPAAPPAPAPTPAPAPAPDRDFLDGLDRQAAETAREVEAVVADRLRAAGIDPVVYDSGPSIAHGDHRTVHDLPGENDPDDDVCIDCGRPVDPDIGVCEPCFEKDFPEGG